MFPSPSPSPLLGSFTSDLHWTFSHSHPQTLHTQQHSAFLSTIIITLHHHYSLAPSHLLTSTTIPTLLLTCALIPTSSMGVVRHHHKHHHHYHWLPTFTFLLFSSASAITTLTPQPSGEAVKQPHREDGSRAAPLDGGAVVDEKRFGGPGSSPPSCRSKCGWCSPCQPVHVPVQPGLIIRLEYYPEAWRCKCGNKLFMP